MKVAISIKGEGLGSEVEPRFGRAEQFLVVETEQGACELINNSANSQAASGAGVQTSRKILDLGVTAVLTGHVGPKAMEILKAGDVRVYTGVSGTAQDALRTFEAGSLEPRV